MLRSRRNHPAVMAGLLAAALSLVWALWLARNAGDLAAQYAWMTFVRHHPGSAYDLSWYGGIHPASYSVLSPYVMAWLGVRTTGVLACVLSAVAGGLLLVRSGLHRPLVPALCLSAAVWCNLAAGRVTYLLGMMFALITAYLALDTARRWPRLVTVATLGAVATLCSPVAGLFVEVLAAALFLVGRRRRAVVLAVGPPVVVAATSLLFPFSGVQPFPWYSALVTAAAAVAVALCTPRSWRTVRAGAWVYALGVVLCWALPTPIGSNVERLALLGGGTVLICAARAGTPRTRRTAGVYAAAAAVAAWTVAQPLADVIHTAPVDATIADAPVLLAELHRLGAEQGRVEVVPLRTHWEASGIAPYFGLARGWNRQADVRRDALFYDGTLTATSYQAWLRDWSVGYVVLPAAELDSGGRAEAELITAGQPWLPLVWQDAAWRIYRVEDANPLAAAPATVTYAGPAALTVRVIRPGPVLLRVAWSPWLAIDGVGDDTTAGPCLSRAGDWTTLSAPRPGTYRIEARYTLDRGTPCR